MSIRLPLFGRATHLFLGSLNDVIVPVVNVDDRVVGDDGSGVAVLIENAGLRDVPVFDR